MKKIYFSRYALADMKAHILYAESFSPALADRTHQLMSQACGALSLFPFAGANLGRRRKFPIPGTTLIFVYRIRGETVQITRCIDGRTNWLKHFQSSE